MNFRTTFLLLILAAGGGAAYWYRGPLAAKLGYAPASADATPDTLYILRRIRPDDIKRIEVTRDGNTVDLVREGKAWNLPGGWPTRGPEVTELVDLLTGLDSRFEPISAGGDSDLTPYGLDKKQKPIAVTLTVALSDPGKTGDFHLLFGEPPERAGNPFTRPTYFRLDDQNQVLRSAPGLLLVLNRSKDDYRKRQLFPDVERVRVGDPKPAFPGEPETPQPTVSLLDARRIAVTGPDGAWVLRRRPAVGPPRKPGAEVTPDRLADDWELAEPAPDGVDPEKLRGALAAVPELWVEGFLTVPNLADAGLDKPERTVKVETDKRTIDLLIGKVSREVEKKAPPPPPPQFGAPPPPPPAIKEVFRFAKLDGNPQVFEVKADKLGDLFVAPAAIRDPRLTRFRSADARRVEIVRPDSQIVLADERDEAAKVDHWKLVATAKADADASKVTELLDRIAELRASGPDIVDKADPKAYGLDPAGAGPHVTVELSEETPGTDKTRKPRTLTMKIGRHDTEKNKVYVQIDGNPRIDAVPDDFLKLFERPALAYRGRRVIDVAAKQVAAIAVQRAGEKFKLEQANGAWKLVEPTSAPADAGKATALANDLSQLEVGEYVSDAPTPDDLTKYGLTAPALSATLTFTDAALPAKTLQIGNPREGKPEVYAKLADAPGVFAIRDAIKTTIDQPSLGYRPLQLWQIAPDTVTAIEIQRGDEKYRLGRDGATWKLTGPFDAPVSAQTAQALVAQVANLRVERYEAHTAGDAAKFGLDKPELKVTVFAKDMEPKALVIGKPAAPPPNPPPAGGGGQGGGRFAKPTDSDAFVVVPATLAAAADRPALDLIDYELLSLNANFIATVRGAGPDGNWDLKREADGWKIASMNPPATADRLAVPGLLRPWADLRAERFVAYGPTIDWAKFGLDKPAATVTVTMQPLNGAAAESHTLSFGRSPDGADDRYARLDDRSGVFLLSAAVAKELARSPLDFVDRLVFAFDPTELIAIRRSGSAGDLELARKDDGWQIVKPTAQRADQPMLDELAERLGGLRAVRVAALNVTDFKPFGLDAPAATVALVLKDKDGKSAEKVLHVGAEVGTTGERNGRVDGQTTVVVLSAAVAKVLVADPLKFRDKAIARFDDADRVFIDVGQRHVILAKIDGVWKMTEPLATEAEATDLGELVTALSRLRADELVAEKPGDLKEYGLDQPEARWRLLAGDKEVLNLLVGKRDPATGRNFAKRASADGVFFLSPDLSTKLLAEYRKRTLWTGLDATGVETLVYSAGEQPLVLQKLNDSWQVPGKPEQQVNATAVNDIVAALAGLKVERFVADKGADLKQFGLQPPQQTIVARTRTGVTATLYLGKTEDGSKRVLARVLDPNRSDVFVLSEADSGRLVKELAAFAK
jgi:hypothetical protein